MFLLYKRTGSSFVIMVIIMAVVVSMFAVSVSQLSRSRSSTLISDATEKQVLYLAEDAANQMMYQLNVDSHSTSINVTDASDVGPNFTYDASYSSGTTPFQKRVGGVGTVRGTGYLMNPSCPTDTSKLSSKKHSSSIPCRHKQQSSPPS